MLNRWTISGVLLTLSMLGGIAFAGLIPSEPQPGVTKRNFERIEKGMTFAEVEAHLGKSNFPPTLMHMGACFFHSQSWYAPDGAHANVNLINDSVQDMSWTDSTENVVDTVRRWLHLTK